MPDENPTFTAVSDTPASMRPSRAFGGGPSTGSPMSSVAPSRTASHLERQQRMDVLREEKRQLKISITKERKRAQRKYLMHQKKVIEVQVRLQQLTMQEREAKLSFAHIDAERVQAQSQFQFQPLYPPQQARTSPHPYLHRTQLALLRMQVQVYTSCVANHRHPHLTRIWWRRLTQLPRHKSNRFNPRILFFRF